MPRKTKGHGMAGRPPKDPMRKVGRNVRTLVTPVIEDVIKDDARTHGINATRRGEVGVDYARLCIYEHLRRVGLITPELYEDPTWDTLKEMGLV
jgi:hypothetical protein